MRPTVKQLLERRDKLLTEEKERGLMQWQYCSFAEETFRGAAVVRAYGIVHAITETHRLGINPGGEVIVVPIPEGEEPPEEYRNRLLTLEVVKQVWPDAVRLGDMEAS